MCRYKPNSRCRFSIYWKETFVVALLFWGGSKLACSEDKSTCLGTAAKIDYHSPLTYDVVRIKLHGDNPMYRTQDLPNGLTLQGIPLMNLIGMAFGARNEQIIGGPEWVRSTQFDLDVRIDQEKSEEFKKLFPKERYSMLRPILLERFHTELETGTRQVGAYNLVIARGGPKLKSHSAADPVDPEKSFMVLSAGKWNMPSTSISFLAAQLSGTVNGIVCDQTGLSDKYDMNLTFSPVDLTAGTQGSNAGDSGPDLFTALKEQLGLQLVPTKELIPVIVIKNASRPAIE
jgi:uncharacterized protein (TIGR03435 family)